MASFIFDVDGTLIDSYDGITLSVENVLNNHNLKIDNVRKKILDSSVLDFLKDISNIINVSPKELYDEYKCERELTQYNYSFMPNAIATLKYLYSKGNKLFIFTHKGEATNKILIDNNIDSLFTDVITSDSDNFKRKPNPYSINYLINKYNLTGDIYYVGDRKIDIECANNSGIKGIYYGENNNIDAKYFINDFKELIEIFE